MKDDTFGQLQSEIEGYKEKCQRLEEECAKKIEENDQMALELKSYQEKYEQLYLSKGSDNRLIMEIDQLQQDNQRLLNMLKQTREYQTFTDFVDDSGGLVKGLTWQSKNSAVINKIPTGEEGAADPE